MDAGATNERVGRTSRCADLPAKSTEKKRKEKIKNSKGGTKGTGRRLRGVLGRSAPGIWRPAPENRAFDKTIVYRKEEKERGKKDRRRPAFYTLAMHHEYEWPRSEVRKAGIHIPGHIRLLLADPSCRLLTLSGRGNRQDTWGYRIYIQRASVFTPAT